MTLANLSSLCSQRRLPLPHHHRPPTHRIRRLRQRRASNVGLPALTIPRTRITRTTPTIPRKLASLRRRPTAGALGRAGAIPRAMQPDARRASIRLGRIQQASSASNT